jgi:hypothetical protein
MPKVEELVSDVFLGILCKTESPTSAPKVIQKERLREIKVVERSKWIKAGLGSADRHDSLSLLLDSGGTRR